MKLVHHIITKVSSTNMVVNDLVLPSRNTEHLIKHSIIVLRSIYGTYIHRKVYQHMDSQYDTLKPVY